jgi:hypothetical protein
MAIIQFQSPESGARGGAERLGCNALTSRRFPPGREPTETDKAWQGKPEAGGGERKVERVGTSAKTRRLRAGCWRRCEGWTLAEA